MDLRLDYTPAPSQADHQGSVKITKVRDAATTFECFVYQCSLEEDFDGAPDAYGLDNPNPDPAEARVNPAILLQHGINGRDNLSFSTSAPHNFQVQLDD